MRVVVWLLVGLVWAVGGYDACVDTTDCPPQYYCIRSQCWYVLFQDAPSGFDYVPPAPAEFGSEPSPIDLSPLPSPASSPSPSLAPSPSPSPDLSPSPSPDPSPSPSVSIPLPAPADASPMPSPVNYTLEGNSTSNDTSPMPSPTNYTSDVNASSPLPSPLDPTPPSPDPSPLPALAPSPLLALAPTPLPSVVPSPMPAPASSTIGNYEGFPAFTIQGLENYLVPTSCSPPLYLTCNNTQFLTLSDSLDFNRTGGIPPYQAIVIQFQLIYEKTKIPNINLFLNNYLLRNIKDLPSVVCNTDPQYSVIEVFEVVNVSSYPYPRTFNPTLTLSWRPSSPQLLYGIADLRIALLPVCYPDLSYNHHFTCGPLPCPQGFQMVNGTCEDLDECSIALQDINDTRITPLCLNGFCVNDLGSYHCECDNGWFGVGCEWSPFLASSNLTCPPQSTKQHYTFLESQAFSSVLFSFRVSYDDGWDAPLHATYSYDSTLLTLWTNKYCKYYHHNESCPYSNYQEPGAFQYNTIGDMFNLTFSNSNYTFWHNNKFHLEVDKFLYLESGVYPNCRNYQAVEPFFCYIGQWFLISSIQDEERGTIYGEITLEQGVYKMRNTTVSNRSRLNTISSTYVGINGSFFLNNASTLSVRTSTIFNISDAVVIDSYATLEHTLSTSEYWIVVSRGRYQVSNVINYGERQGDFSKTVAIYTDAEDRKCKIDANPIYTEKTISVSFTLDYCIYFNRKDNNSPPDFNLAYPIAFSIVGFLFVVALVGGVVFLRYKKARRDAELGKMKSAANEANNPKSIHCKACKKKVYPNDDQIFICEGNWHARCLKCSVCGMALTALNIHPFKQQPYCVSHKPVLNAAM